MRGDVVKVPGRAGGFIVSEANNLFVKWSGEGETSLAMGGETYHFRGLESIKKVRPFSPLYSCQIMKTIKDVSIYQMIF